MRDKIDAELDDLADELKEGRITWCDSFLRFLDVEKAPLHRDEFVRMERVRMVSCFALSLLN